MTKELRNLYGLLSPHIPLLIGLPSINTLEKAKQFSYPDELPNFLCTGFTIGGTDQVPLFILSGGYYNSEGIFTQLNTPRKPLALDAENSYEFTAEVRELIEKIKDSLLEYMAGASDAPKQGNMFEDEKVTNAKILPPAQAGHDGVSTFKEEIVSSPADVAKGIVEETNGLQIKNQGKRGATVEPAKRVAQSAEHPSGIKGEKSKKK